MVLTSDTCAQLTAVSQPVGRGKKKKKLNGGSPPSFERYNGGVMHICSHFSRSDLRHIPTTEFAKSSGQCGLALGGHGSC